MIFTPWRIQFTLSSCLILPAYLVCVICVCVCVCVCVFAKLPMVFITLSRCEQPATMQIWAQGVPGHSLVRREAALNSLVYRSGLSSFPTWPKYVTHPKTYTG